VDPGPLGHRAEPGSRKLGSQGSREPARRSIAFRGAIVDAAAARGVEVVRSHRRDIDALPGVVRPMALGFRTEEVQRMITVGPFGGPSGPTAPAPTAATPGRHVVFGRNTAQTGPFPASLKLSGLDGTNGFRLNGVAGRDQSGFAVSSAGMSTAMGSRTSAEGRHPHMWRCAVTVPSRWNTSWKES
jgi:hypothetical protein